MDASHQFALLDNQWRSFSNTIQYYFQIGPYKVCLSFATLKLTEKIVPAFDHLIIDPVDKPDFIICLWDVNDIGQRLPDLDWTFICSYGYRGYKSFDIYFQYYDQIGALSFINIVKNKAFYVVRDSALLPWWVSGCPLEIILDPWLSHHGLKMTHTAAVGNHDSAILLCGKGGSGKSTTTLACMRSGLNYIGEDYCILGSGKKPVVYSLYQSAKWELNTRKLFPYYEHQIKNPIEANSQKALVFYKNFFPERIKLSLPISGVVSLNIGSSQEPKLKKCNSELSVKNLMMSTLRQLPLSHLSAVAILKDIVSKVGCYELTLGRDIEANVAVIRNLL